LLPRSQEFRPALRHDRQEVQCHLPPAREIARREVRKPQPVRAFGLDLVHQAGEIAGEPDRIRRGRRHHHLLLEHLGDMGRQPALPRADQRREIEQAVDW
jgi:hypothetical protein